MIDRLRLPSPDKLVKLFIRGGSALAIGFTLAACEPPSVHVVDCTSYSPVARSGSLEVNGFEGAKVSINGIIFIRSKGGLTITGASSSETYRPIGKDTIVATSGSTVLTATITQEEPISAPKLRVEGSCN